MGDREGPPQLSGRTDGRGSGPGRGVGGSGAAPWTPGGLCTAGGLGRPMASSRLFLTGTEPSTQPACPPDGSAWWGRPAIPGLGRVSFSLFRGGRAEGDPVCGAHSLPCVQSRAGQGAAGGLSCCPRPRAGSGGLSSRGSAVPQAEEEKRRKKEEAARKRQEQEVASASAGGARSRKAL